MLYWRVQRACIGQPVNSRPLHVAPLPPKHVPAGARLPARVQVAQLALQPPHASLSSEPYAALTQLRELAVRGLAVADLAHLPPSLRRLSLAYGSDDPITVPCLPPHLRRAACRRCAPPGDCGASRRGSREAACTQQGLTSRTTLWVRLAGWTGCRCARPACWASARMMYGTAAPRWSWQPRSCCWESPCEVRRRAGRLPSRPYAGSPAPVPYCHPSRSPAGTPPRAAFRPGPGGHI
jgi:hypothetical protein